MPQEKRNQWTNILAIVRTLKKQLVSVKEHIFNAVHTNFEISDSNDNWIQLAFLWLFISILNFALTKESKPSKNYIFFFTELCRHWIKRRNPGFYGHASIDKYWLICK